ncbi:hypothetical protein [Nostoc sp. CCY0012]
MTLSKLWILDFELQMNADNYPKSLVSISLYWHEPFSNIDGRK